MKIVVKSEELKNQILEQSKYVHDFLEVVKYKNKKGEKKEKWIGLDSDKAGLLMHLYLNPDMIEVVEEEKSEIKTALDFIKNLETWITITGRRAREIVTITRKLTPISTSSSLHVDEERYEIDGEIYILLTAIGGSNREVTVQRLNKK